MNSLLFFISTKKNKINSELKNKKKCLHTFLRRLWQLFYVFVLNGKCFVFLKISFKVKYEKILIYFLIQRLLNVYSVFLLSILTVFLLCYWIMLMIWLILGIRKEEKNTNFLVVITFKDIKVINNASFQHWKSIYIYHKKKCVYTLHSFCFYRCRYVCNVKIIECPNI